MANTGDKLLWVIGFHAVQTLLKTNPDNAIELHCSTGRRDQRNSKTIQLARRNDIPVINTKPDVLNQMVNSKQHQGVALKVINDSNQYNENWLLQRIDELLAANEAPFILALDQVTDPHNLGAILRSADGAGVNAVIVPRDNACGITPVVRKVASGAVNTVPLIMVTNLSRLLGTLQDKGLWLTGLCSTASNLYNQQDYKLPTVIVMGAEATGMRRLTREHCDFLVNIPMNGKVDSLNVSVATGVVLYEVVRQRQN